jgi:hypothetical protein
LNVPNTTTFSLHDVTFILYGDTDSGRNLSVAFNDAPSGNFDPTYSGYANNSLLLFRNYARSVFNFGTASISGAGPGTIILNASMTNTTSRSITYYVRFRVRHGSIWSDSPVFSITLSGGNGGNAQEMWSQSMPDAWQCFVRAGDSNFVDADFVTMSTPLTPFFTVSNLVAMWNPSPLHTNCTYTINNNEGVSRTYYIMFELYHNGGWISSTINSHTISGGNATGGNIVVNSASKPSYYICYVRRGDSNFTTSDRVESGLVTS